MRAGLLDRTITLQSFAASVNAAGTPQEQWSDFATVRAQKVEASTEEYLAGFGESDRTVVIFRTWWIDGVINSMRVVFEGRNLNIRETKEIGRRRGLELRCEEVRT